MQAWGLQSLFLVLISLSAMNRQVKPCLMIKVGILHRVIVEYADMVLIVGASSLDRQSLHHIGDVLNPYEQSILIIGEILAAFNVDNLIPCFGFGDGISLQVHNLIS